MTGSKRNRHMPKKSDRKISTPMIVALIGGISTILVAVLQLAFKDNPPEPLSTLTIEPTLIIGPTLTIEPIMTVTPIPAGLPELVDGKNVPMVLIPAGEFVMGNDNGYSDEIPAHSVYLYNYYIDKYEVTNELFATYLNRIASRVAVNSDEYVYLKDEFFYDLVCSDCNDWIDGITWDGTKFISQPGYLNHPVALVSWYGAKAYCEWRGARLPTEAEWEKAAKGPNGKFYPWGNAEAIDCSYANYNRCINTTTIVGVYDKGKSFYGVYDMAGNVREWVNSIYQPYPYTTIDGRENTNTTIGYRVNRGGSWASAFDSMRSSYRGYNSMNHVDNGLGFRCARNP